MDYTQLLDQTVQFLKPAAVAGQAIGTKIAASTLWDWMKDKFKRRSPAAAEAVTDVEKSPDKAVNWEVLRAQLAKALAEDETLRKELAGLLARHAPAVTQQADVSGIGNVTTQISGNENSVDVQR